MQDLMENFYISPQGKAALIVWGISILIFLIFFIILARRISESINISQQNNGRINQYLAAVPSDKIGTVQAIYQNTRKNLGAAMIIAIIGGSFGFQRIYLGKRNSAVLMFLFFWTGIPTVISIFDITRMPATISEYNLNVVRSLYDQLAAPKIE